MTKTRVRVFALLVVTLSTAVACKTSMADLTRQIARAEGDENHAELVQRALSEAAPGDTNAQEALAEKWAASPPQNPVFKEIASNGKELPGNHSEPGGHHAADAVESLRRQVCVAPGPRRLSDYLNNTTPPPTLSDFLNGGRGQPYYDARNHLIEDLLCG